MSDTSERNDEQPVDEESAPTASFGPGMVGLGEQIGRYKLLRILGEGGFGIVYLAEQQRPMKRQVALKIIKPGMDSAQVIRRFEAERQALALLDHPNVAHVYDAGTTESGRPYFVMEYVKGVPITEHCDRQKLTIEERLRLFVKVCEAIQHAHQKGIIHRDIKPSNIQVYIQGKQAVPKVIDFGVAKALTQPLTERTLVTEQGQMLGTPEYISPEQAEMTNQDIDTRSDIYSLGVVLYELLTGTLPLESQTLRKGSLEQMREVIREAEPITPSTRISSLGADESIRLSKCRQSDADTLRRKLHGDLDWITLKAMEKDRVRRYQTAHALAEDVERHLNNEPVLARGPSTTYRLGKFLRRRRSQALAGLMIAAVVSAFIVVLVLWNQNRFRLAEADALRHRDILSQARESLAQGDRETAAKLVESVLNSRHVGPKAQLLLAGILVEGRQYDEAVPRLESLVKERPEIAGAAYALLARILWERPSFGPGEVKKVELYRQKAEELLPKTAEAYYLRAMTAFTIPEKFRLLEEALDLDSSHYESRSLRALTYQASRKYEDLKDDALLMTYSRPRDPLGYSLRANALKELGDYEKAIECYDNAIGLTPKDDPQYIELNSRRCEILIQMGQYERAIADAEDCLRIAPGATVLHFHIFCALTALGRYELASAVFQHIDNFDLIALGGPRHWSMKYVFDTLEAGRVWHPPDSKPEGPAFLPMVKAEETHRKLSVKARRLITDSFTAQWSPDGTKVAFSMGVQGYSGVAIFEPITGETELLIVPGKDPRWSPDGKYIAFVRDCQVLRVSEFTAAERRDQHRPLADEEVWIMKSNGSEPRRLARGGWPFWSTDSTRVYYHSRGEKVLCSISIMDRDIKPKRIMTYSDLYAFPTVSPDNQRVAYWEGAFLKVKDLASQTLIAEWRVPLGMWSVSAWSPTSNELSMGGPGSVNNLAGLWIYPVNGGEPVRVLSDQITYASWSPDGTKLVLDLGPPYYEIWIADLHSGLSAVEALGPGRTVEEHCLERIEACNQELKVDPNLFHNHMERITSALWIGSDQVPLYLQELGSVVDRAPIRPYICYFYARRILTNSALHDRLLPLALVLAHKAVEKEPAYAKHLAPVLYDIGQQDEADRLLHMAEATTNFLANGGFEKGVLDPWNAYGNATTEVVTELVGAVVRESPVEGKFCLYIDVAPDIANVSDAGLQPLGEIFEAGKKYTISAFLKTRKGSLDITFKPELGKRPWTGYGEQVITISDTWAEYHVTTPEFTENVNPASFTFHIGAATGGFWIDDVRFYEGDYVPTIAEK